MPERQNSLHQILMESRYSELKEKSQSSAVGSLILLVIYENAVFESFHWQLTNTLLFSTLLLLTLARMYHAKLDRLSISNWMMSYSVISGMIALNWSLLLNNSILFFIDKPEVAGFSYIVYGGLIAAAAYSLSISRMDFFMFQGLILSSILISIYMQPRFAELRTGAFLMVITFFLFLMRQRKIWSQIWHNQKVAAYESQTILDAFPGGITIIENGRYKATNKYIRESFALKNKDIIGKEVGFFAPQSDSAKVIRACIESAEPKRTQHELIFASAQGSREHMLIIEPLTQNRENKEFIVISIDVHEQKVAQSELEKQRLALEHSAKMAALGEMSSGLAHEINNPLAVISARTHQLMHLIAAPTLDLAKIRTGVENINKTTYRIAKIIKGLRTFARDVENDPFTTANLKEIILETLTFCEARFRAHDIEIDTTSLGDNLIVECKATQISQVLLNALNNSHDAIEKQETPKWIRIETRDEGTHIALLITDSGDGIPEALRSKLMQPFFTTKEVGKGTGLGLSLSKGIIEMHKGTFEFNFNHPNTQLVIRLPKKQSDTAAA